MSGRDRHSTNTVAGSMLTDNQQVSFYLSFRWFLNDNGSSRLMVLSRSALSTERRLIEMNQTGASVLYSLGIFLCGSRFRDIGDAPSIQQSAFDQHQSALIDIQLTERPSRLAAMGSSSRANPPPVIAVDGSITALSDRDRLLD